MTLVGIPARGFWVCFDRFDYGVPRASGYWDTFKAARGAEAPLAEEVKYRVKFGLIVYEMLVDSSANMCGGDEWCACGNGHKGRVGRVCEAPGKVVTQENYVKDCCDSAAAMLCKVTRSADDTAYEQHFALCIMVAYRYF
jgi:hypothetical protein